MFKFYLKNLKTNQSGVVLIVSLMILVVMIISVISLSRVIVGEVKMTRNSDNSIVSFYVAESGVEKALYYLKLGRQATDFSDFNALAGTSAFLDNERNLSFASATTTSEYFEAFDIATSSPATAEIALSDGLIPEGASENLPNQYNIEWSIDGCYPSHASDRLEIAATSLYKQSGTMKSETQQNQYVCGCGSTSDQCDVITSSSIADNKFYYFNFRPLTDTVSYLKFIPYSTKDNKNYYSGEANIEVVGNYRQSSHTINVKVNTLAPASNIFSYVLFSDDELSKGY